MTCAPAGQHRRTRIRWLAGQTGLVIGLIAVYFGVRGLVGKSVGVAHANAQDIVALELRLGINVEHELQEPFARTDALQTLANWIYIYGHWPVIIVTMLWLAIRHRPVFLRLRDGMVVSGALGMVIFMLYPVAPPRLAGLGLVDTVTETSSSYRIMQPPAFVNQYAAMPSLHSGWDLLVGIAIVTAASSLTLRIVGYVMPWTMAIAVVATANHYLLDVVVGIALVLCGHWMALRLERRRLRRAAQAENEPDQLEVDAGHG